MMVLGFALLFLFIFFVLRRVLRGSAPVLAPEVGFDEVSITHANSRNDSRSLDWDELASVEIWTTDEGPWAEDVYWVLTGAGSDGPLIVENGADGARALVSRLQELEGFSDIGVLIAMGSTDNARFPIWSRASAEAVEQAEPET